MIQKHKNIIFQKKKGISPEMSDVLSKEEEVIFVQQIRALTRPSTMLHNEFSIHKNIQKYKKRYVRDTKVDSLPLVPAASAIPNYYEEEVDGRPSLLSKLEDRALRGRLFDRQRANFNRTIYILLHPNMGFPLNTSQQGTGKTFVQCAVALYFDMDLFTLSPLSVKPKWNDTSLLFGVNVIFAESYETFRGKAHNTIKHPYLIRSDVFSVEEKMESTFETTPAFHQLLAQRRVLFVFDEIQKIKDPKSDLARSCHALMEKFPLDCERIKVICCTGTVIDKIQFCESLLKMLGVLRGGKMYEYIAAVGGGYTRPTESWKEMVAIAKQLSPEETSMILSLNKLNSVKDFYWVAFLLYRDVFRCYLANQMPNHDLTFVQMDVANGFYTVSTELEELITEQLNAITECLHMKKNRLGQEVVDMSGLAAAMPHMVELQRLKTSIFVALTRWYISIVPNAKIILFVTFKDVMRILQEQLADLGAVVMNGSTTGKQREVLIRRFQEPNLNCRVMISNPRVGGVGIDLDDKTGDFPRAMFLMLDFAIIDLIQSIWRALRADTKQNSAIPALFARFVYTNTKNGAQELRILQILHEKELILSQVLAEPKEDMFPSRNVRYDASFAEIEDFNYVPLLRKMRGC